MLLAPSLETRITTSLGVGCTVFLAAVCGRQQMVANEQGEL